MNEKEKIEHLIERTRVLGEELHELRDRLNEWCAKLADLLTNLVNLRVYLEESKSDERRQNRG